MVNKTNPTTKYNNKLLLKRNASIIDEKYVYNNSDSVENEDI